MKDLKKYLEKIIISVLLIEMIFIASCNNIFLNSIKVKSISDYDKDTTIESIETISFGEYPQSGGNNSLKEPIEWIVLDKYNDKTLLLSKYILDSKCFNDDWSNGLWETCSLRKWLNEDFYNIAFNEDEQKMIVPTQLKNTYSMDYKTKGGNDTIDNIFCLSIDEMYMYFGKGKKATVGYKVGRSAVTRGTNYAKKNDDNSEKLFIVKSGEFEGSSVYWLRSVGKSNSSATCVMFDMVDDIGGKPESKGVGVRPAIWISAFTNDAKEMERMENIIKLFNRENNYGFDKVYLKKKEYNWVIDEDYLFIDSKENIIVKVHCDYGKKRQRGKKIKSIKCDFYNTDEINIDYNEYSEPKLLSLNSSISNIYDRIGDHLFEARKEYVLHNKKQYKK